MSLKYREVLNTVSEDDIVKIFLDDVTTVPTLETNVFTGTPDTLKIIVPDNLVDSFKTDSSWSTYANKIIGITEYESTLT